MDKKGQNGETIFGLAIIIFLVVVTIFGFLSSNICDRLLIGVGISGLIWILSGNSMQTKMETRGFIFFLPLSIILLIIWIILKTTGVCIPISEYLSKYLNLTK